MMLAPPLRRITCPRLLFDLPDWEVAVLEAFPLVLSGACTKKEAFDSAAGWIEAHRGNWARNLDGHAIQSKLEMLWEQTEAAQYDGDENAKLDAESLKQDALREGAQWLKYCAFGKNGQPFPSLENAMVALRSDPKFRDAFQYNEMLLAPVLVAQLTDDPFTGPRRVTDIDVSVLQERLQIAGLKMLGKETTHQAVDLRAKERSFHPVRDWLRSVQWDGVPRLSSWLRIYLGCQQQDSAYLEAVGRMFLIAMVARIFKPGCKVDHMLVFEGAQGNLKSTACKILGGEDHFSDNLPELTNEKDASQHLRGKWLIEVSEMHAMSRVENSHLKAFVTRTHERYRPSYARKEVEEPRQCVFAGTTNKQTYLKDETGGRRFWPVVTGEIDIAGLARDRDQLFAEAVHAYEQGERWWPDGQLERAIIAPQQSERYESDVWEEKIGDYLAGATDPVTIGQVGNEALHLETPRTSKQDQIRIGTAMERLGWRRLAKHSSGKRCWWRADLAAPRGYRWGGVA
jgi:predicted P-loop ATPase